MGQTSTVRTTGICLMIPLSLLFLSSAAWAQQASGIAGTARDTSGAVLPGVTVEAASPALIEKVRTAVTDGEGRYSIIDLRLGAYTVTFTLAGFSTVRREGIELPSGFTATVNADMKVGSLEETITVTGASPLVDTQSVRQQKVISNDLLSTLPTGTGNLTTLVALTPGLSGRTDVGGTRGTWGGLTPNDNRYHGKASGKMMYDGMRIQNPAGNGGSPGYMFNLQTVEEIQVEIGGLSPEAGSAGLATNFIPKEGGNAFKFDFTGRYTNRNMQSDNLTDELRARGLTDAPRILRIYDGGVTVGGPIKKGRAWFFGVYRRWGSKIELTTFLNKTQGTMFYTPDLDRRASSKDWNRSHAGRVTWQVSPRNKVNVFTDIQNNCLCYSAHGSISADAFEAVAGWNIWPTGILQGTWSSPLTSKLLLEAGAAAVLLHWPSFRQPGVSRDDISILEQSTTFRYNAPISIAPERQTADRYVQRFGVTYMTGSHTFKAGFQTEQTVQDQVLEEGGRPEARGVSYTFLRGAPVSLTMRAAPLNTKVAVKPDLGIYAQDQWIVKRLTLNGGVRFEYINGQVPENHLPAGPFVPARDFAAVHQVPGWKDLYPRLGMSYDLFGNSRTAVKAAVGRYGEIVGLTVPGANDPVATSVTSVDRAWIDANGNYVPDCDLRNPALNGECGPFLNQNFGKNNPSATRWADDALRGWGVRNYLWEISAEVQHQLAQRLSVTGGYYRTWNGNFRVTDNLAVTPANFSPYCITAPVDARLPGGGGYQVCGLYDLNPDKVGQVNNLVTQSSHYTGPNSRFNCAGADFQAVINCGLANYFAASVDARFAPGTRFGGGVDIGRTVIDNCVVIDSPQQLLNCRTVPPWSAGLQIKLNGSYQLPRAFAVSGTFQNVAGLSYTADYPATSAEIAPSLGRSLSGGRRSVNVPLVALRSEYEPRRTQIDLRLSKAFKLKTKGRLQANFDLYNVLNQASVLAVVNTYGPRWLQPREVLPGRLFQVSGELTF